MEADNTSLNYAGRVRPGRAVFYRDGIGSGAGATHKELSIVPIGRRQVG